MRKPKRSLPILGIGGLLLVLNGAGCCPLGFGFLCSAPAAPGSGTPNTPAAPNNNDAVQAKKPDAAPPGTPGHCPTPGGILPVGYEPPSQALAALSQKLAAADDERQVLVARLHQLDGLLQARDQALAAAAQEIDLARTEITTTRSEMERWRREMTTLREKLRSTEAENKGTLESIINMLEQVLEEHKEASPAKKAAGP